MCKNLAAELIDEEDRGLSRYVSPFAPARHRGHARINAEVAEGVARLAAEGIHVGLGTILVGDDVPSERYVAMKHEDCATLGMYSAGEHLPATATQAEVLDVIARFNDDPKISAFLVQLPLPDGLDETQALLAVDPAKDVDGLHPVNLGRLVIGTPGQLPCTPAGIVELLHALTSRSRAATP